LNVSQLARRPDWRKRVPETRTIELGIAQERQCAADDKEDANIEGISTACEDEMLWVKLSVRCQYYRIEWKPYR